MRPWGVVALATVLVLLAVLPMTPGHGTGPSPNPAQSHILGVGTLDQMKTRNILAPFALDDSYTMAVLARVYDTAVQRDPATGAVFPRLAVGVDGNGNGRLDAAEVGNFTVPAGAPTVTVFYNFWNVRFHDGISVNVMDVLFSYHVLALHPRVWGPLWVLMDKGGGPGSNASTDRWLWVNAMDDGDGNVSTSALRFTRQFPYAPFSFATLGIPVLPRHIWEGTGGGRHADFGQAIYPEGHPRQGQGIPVTETAYLPFNLAAAEAWQMTDGDVIGSGHFRFGTWSFGAFVRLDANPDYAFGRPKVDVILFQIYRTTQLAVIALQSGQIDLILDPLPPEFIPDLRNNPGIGLAMAPSLFPASLLFNTRRQPFGYSSYPPADSRIDDVGLPFRQAFAHLIDKATVLRVLLQNYGATADGFVSPFNTAWYNRSLPQISYDPAQASLILDNAGWTIGPNGWRVFPRLGDSQFEILTPQADFDPIIASTAAMIAAAAQSVHVNVVSRATAFGAILAALNVRDFDLAIVEDPDVHANDAWTLWRGDPDYLFDLFHSSNQAAGRNRAGFWDTPFDARIGASRVDADPTIRANDVRWAQGILSARLPGIPMYYQNLTTAYRSDRYEGWKLIASTLFNYWSLQGIHSAPNPGPKIALVSPPDGALISRGTVIDLQVTDTDLSFVDFTLDAGFATYLPPPYDVATSGWPDGFHSITVRATDSAGNTTRADFNFTVDGTPPSIVLRSPPNGALVPGGTVIDLAVTDAHLLSVGVKIDGGGTMPLPPPYDVPMAGLPDGPHTFEVRAVDQVGNVAVRPFSFTLDATRPAIVIRTPEGALPSAPSGVRVTFSESVNTTSVESAFSMTDGTRTWTARSGSFFWSADQTSFTFIPDSALAEGKEHRVTLAGTLTDKAGNPMGQDVVWTFSTPAGAGGPWVLATGIASSIAAALGLVLLFVVLRRRRKGPAAKGKT